ncbi:MAG: hypothetical protein HND44_02575 [Chloroflexi bacterium]|nr:hypothetical protein [Ardenticatenaceae bacterium]MBL1127384.1 hypothetical protein [Chloroflexota bacterium]NOG33446.1 hypothetical protein [Chloroflexota bacterium]GIK58542.1 MAG: hypothetical protein BroJett015_42050 [Chloroflexota bacterium]
MSDQRPKTSSPHHPIILSPARLLTVLLIILALAAGLRFWRLAQMPPGLYHDEAYNGLDALSLLQGKTFPQFYEGWELYQNDAHAERPAQETRWPVFFEGNYGREPLHIYLMALSIKLFGATPFAIRAVPAFFGVLSVLTTFLAAKALFDVREWRSESGDHALRITPCASPITDHRLPITTITPLVAAFTLAVLFPAIHFSRFGLRMMVYVFVETLAIYCFWKGVNGSAKVPGDQASSGQVLDARLPHHPITQPPAHPISPSPSPLLTPATLWFIAAGFLLGLGIYTYAVGRLLPLLFVLFVPLWFWREREAVRQQWLNVGLMAGTAVLTALPLLLYFWRYPYFFVFRMAYVSNRGVGAVEGKPWLTWLQNVWRVIAGLFWQGETHLRHNLPGRPYLDPLQAIFFLTGMITALKHLFHPRLMFLYLWLLVMLLPTVLSGDAPHFGRMSGAAPVIAIFVGLGVDWIGYRLAVSGYWSPIIVYGLLITLLFASALWTTYDYFGRYGRHPQLAADFYQPEWEMGQFAASFGENTVIYLTPTQEELATLYFALGSPERLQNYAGEEGAIPLGIPGQETLYLVRPLAVTSLKNLQNAFPDGIPGEPSEGYIPFTVPANKTRQLAEHTSDHRFGDQIRLVGWTVEKREEKTAVTLIWEAVTGIPQDYTAFVHLIGPDGRLVAQQDRQPGGHPTSSWRPGEWVMDTFVIPLPPDLNREGLTIQTGFYYLPTLERPGEAARIGEQ